jgi:hypothetical protein
VNDVPTTSAEGIWARLPEWARPLDRERHGLGSRRLAESTILILIGLFLVVATVNDVVLQTHVNHRLSADLATWRKATGHNYVNIDTEQDIKTYTTRDTVCGNVSPGAPGERAQICLNVVGPVVSGVRTVTGGFYLPPYHPNLYGNRYACFGLAKQQGLCDLTAAPAGSPPDPPLPTGRP